MGFGIVAPYIELSMLNEFYLWYAVKYMATEVMEQGKKKPFIIRNVEWITLLILILAGLIAVWRIYYPGIFSNG
jgi:hypothetical protein